MDLATLRDKRAALKIEFDGETINAEILPHKLTPEYRARLQKLAKEEGDGDERDADAQMVSELVASWDITAGGEPYPPTYENLREIPIALLTITATAILEYVGKLATTGRPSG